MNFLKEVVRRKYEEYFIELKNNRFNPNLFYEAISLANAYFEFFSSQNIQIRVTLLHAFNWEILEKSMNRFAVDEIELKTDYNMKVKNDWSMNVIACTEMLMESIRQDDELLNRFYNDFRKEGMARDKMASLPDIKLDFSLGIVKSNA